MPSFAGGEDAASRRPMRPVERALSLRHALALGLLQGPAELLPISSSGHIALLPWLAGWPYGELDGEARKAFEVALHAGGAAALAIDMRSELIAHAARLDGRRAAVLALSLAPPSIAGLALRAPIERRLGGPRTIAAALLAGGVAMALADAHGASPGDGRECEDAGALDGLLLGVAQALALVPGVSRNGATLTAARARGFERGGAHSLSWAVALPVIVGAGALKGARLARGGARREDRAALAVGAGSAFLSTLASATLMRRGAAGERPLLPYSLYRCLLAALVIERVRREG
jgi:undecaprenyl-diphosphatase